MDQPGIAWTSPEWLPEMAANLRCYLRVLRRAPWTMQVKLAVLVPQDSDPVGFTIFVTYLTTLLIGRLI